MDPDPHWRLSAPEPDWLFTLISSYRTLASSPPYLTA